MIKIAITTFILGVLVYVLTAAVLGKKKANALPGGAIGGAIGLALIMAACYWYVAIICSLLGHVAAVLVAKKL